MTPLAEFEKSVYSQYGEDGVIGEMLERLKRAPNATGGALSGVRAHAVDKNSPVIAQSPGHK